MVFIEGAVVGALKKIVTSITVLCRTSVLFGSGDTITGAMLQKIYTWICDLEDCTIKEAN